MARKPLFEGPNSGRAPQGAIRDSDTDVAVFANTCYPDLPSRRPKITGGFVTNAGVF